MLKDILDLPAIGRAGTLHSVDEAGRSFDVLWTTGAQVRRYSWARDEEFDEELVVSPNAMRLDRLNAGAPFLNSHSSWSLRDILGVVEDGSIRIEGGKAYARIRLSERDDVEPVWRDIKDGIIRNVSVGYRVHRFERIAKADRTDGGERALYRAIDWEPLEISAVAIGADPGAGMHSDAAEPDTRRNSCVFITRQSPAAPAATSEKGHVMSDQTTTAGADERSTTAQAHAPETAPASAAATAPAPVIDAEATRAEERARAAEIGTICARHGLGDAFRDQLIRDGVSMDQARTLILDRLVETDPVQRTVEPAPAQVRGTCEREAQYRDAMSNALLHRASAPGIDLTDAGREFRGLTLMELARHALERSGVSTRGLGRMEIAAAALGQRAVAVARVEQRHAVRHGRVLEEDRVDQVTLELRRPSAEAVGDAGECPEIIVDQHLPAERDDLAVGRQRVLRRCLAEGAVFELGSLGHLLELRRVRDLHAGGRPEIGQGRPPRPRGEGAGRRGISRAQADIADVREHRGKVPGGVIANLGAASVIEEDAFIAAYEAFAAQTDIDGTAIDVSPEFIIVPPGQRAVEARKLLTATTPSTTGDVNTFANRLQVVEERRLMPSSGNQAPWFLAASTGLIDTIEYAYLDGQQGVFTESRNGFEVDGVEIKARLDFAASAIDWRGLYKNAGAAPV